MIRRHKRRWRRFVWLLLAPAIYAAAFVCALVRVIQPSPEPRRNNQGN